MTGPSCSSIFLRPSSGLLRASRCLLSGSRVIGDRAFSPSPEVVTDLGRAYLAGMRDAGMRSCGKHFPGHGSVEADSHTDDVTDARPLQVIERSDLAPFRALLDDLDALLARFAPGLAPEPGGAAEYERSDGQVIESGSPEQLRDAGGEWTRQFMQGLPDGPVPFHYPAPALAGDLFGEGG